MAWDDGAQPTAKSAFNFSFYDQIVKNIPSGVQAIIVLTGVPSWMKDPSNWIDGNPRKTFAQKWVSTVAARYKLNASVGGYQIWNEPNDVNNPNNDILGVTHSAASYVEMLQSSYQAIKSVAPKALVLNAATTSIIQSYPSSLTYNRQMKAAGAEKYIDIWAAHLYGKSVENIIRPGGVGSFLRTSSKPVWITESGAKGINNQREYVERYWTFFRKNIKKISVKLYEA